MWGDRPGLAAQERGRQTDSDSEEDSDWKTEEEQKLSNPSG